MKARHIFQSKKTKNSFVNGGEGGGLIFFFVDLFLPNILSKIVVYAERKNMLGRDTRGTFLTT